MKIRKRLAALPLTALVTLAPDVPAQVLGGAQTEQNRQQRLEAQQREATVAAPAVRSEVPNAQT
jgi:hemolysin activation/secretion protein